MLRDLLGGEDAQMQAALDVIAAAAPDILLLTDTDWDEGGAGLAALSAALAERGLALPHVVSPRPNSGMATGLDMDGDGRTGTPRDAQGYGRFAGDGAPALLSRWEIDTAGLRDFTGLLWRDLPGATLPVPDGAPFPSEGAQAVQRLSSTAHWVVPVRAPGGPVAIAAFSATPPVFDGAEDRNGLRNADEVRLWQLWLDGVLGAPPDGPVAILGNAQLDPEDGEGRREAIRALLAHPRLQDPAPQSGGGAGAADPDQRGDPSLDTAEWDGPGNLRVSYVLPSRDWIVTESGVLWPPPGDPLAEAVAAAGPHRLVWVDLARPD
ncbi:endonuclease/exonuclease/phosphatase family protein [Wenxinia saemankumensis]|uniref:Endonuclease/Exonuclease/phosphatase family protein n=1 Tax=Wenxinia saemankumensis TaxID=1447782 RepID=A0A1M6G0C7_9RHOB|nr:endonuclease/exonuclease/phosphatase family protein [Wenxinia saemankumensis]SHJ03390.1 Endonuclease/Exonuclease/phosphatase family protein [Wenxinia saemankumensis]